MLTTLGTRDRSTAVLALGGCRSGPPGGMAARGRRTTFSLPDAPVGVPDRHEKGSGGGLSDLASRLEGDARGVEGKTGLGDLIGGLLDSDDDGSVLDDLGRLAGDDVLGSLLGGR